MSKTLVLIFMVQIYKQFFNIANIFAFFFKKFKLVIHGGGRTHITSHIIYRCLLYDVTSTSKGYNNDSSSF